MGIPSYFKHIVKKHREIIKKFSLDSVDNLYLDSNSIIYDCARDAEFEEKHTQKEKFKIIISSVIDKIIYYINYIKPKKRVFIAFDGVAPYAKLQQQRERRYKSSLEKKLFPPKNKLSFNTVNITPGTRFMKLLDTQIKKYFKKNVFYNLNNTPINIKISTSTDAGEGEHKIFQYVRDNVHHKTETTVIYGLDADLIMLTLCHLKYCKELHLYRETPHFIKSIDSTLDPNENYILDIAQLNEGILSDMTNKDNGTINYIFLFFLLGNDFMPHFPSLNIRTQGVNILLNTYNMFNKNIVDHNDKIIWNNFKEFIQILVDMEESLLKNEQKSRDKYSKLLKTKEMDEYELYLNAPILERHKELQINFYKYGWENRYYNILFNKNYNVERICRNYIDGLEWNLTYYTTNKIDISWKYEYSYPPLLKDLLKYIPDTYNEFSLNTLLYKNSSIELLTQSQQLAYVIPKQHLNLLSRDNKKKIIEHNVDWYNQNAEIETSFCRYFWESHVKMPEIDINILKSIII